MTFTNNVLLIPGNHDINRSELESYCDKNDIDELEAEKYYEVKLGNYLEFYERFKEKKNVDISRSIYCETTPSRGQKSANFPL